MRHLLLPLLFLAFFASHADADEADMSSCSEVEIDVQYYDETKPHFFEVRTYGDHNPLLEGGQVHCRIVSQNRGAAYRVNLTEEGTVHGFRYRIDRHGRGTVQGQPGGQLDDLAYDNWTIFCLENMIDDTRVCGTTLRVADISVDILDDGQLRVSVGSYHLPGSEIAIRFDRGTPIRANAPDGFSPEQSRSIIEELREGRKFVVRFRKADGELVQGEFDVYGFRAAVAVMEAVWGAYWLPDS